MAPQNRSSVDIKGVFKVPFQVHKKHSTLSKVIFSTHTETTVHILQVTRTEMLSLQLALI